jgi:hypothetical protein
VPILLPIDLLIVPFAVRTLVPLGHVEKVCEWKARVYEKGQIVTLERLTEASPYQVLGLTVL